MLFHVSRLKFFSVTHLTLTTISHIHTCPWPKQCILMHCLGLWYVFFFLFPFSVTNSCHPSQWCDAMWHDDNPHPKPHHLSAPPFPWHNLTICIYHHLSPLTSTMSMAQMMHSDMSLGPYGMFFFIILIFSLLISTTSANNDAMWCNVAWQ